MKKNESKNNKVSFKKSISIFVLMTLFFLGNFINSANASGSTITLNHPTTGTIIQKGTTLNITGVSLAQASYYLNLYKESSGGVVANIGSGMTYSTSSIGNVATDFNLTYSWAVPTTLTDASDYKIQVVKNSTIGSSGQETTYSPFFTIGTPLTCTPPQVLDVTTNTCVTAVVAVSGNGTIGGIINHGTSTYSKLFVQTNDADNVTDSTATLHGVGGDQISNPTLPITAYFRYSKAAISPLYCNDIYGTNMMATRDIKLGITSSEPFYQKIENLTPNTLYYYCAILSNKENIAYGGGSTVKSFHTSPLSTTVQTDGVTNITATSAEISGSYSSGKTVTTYFEYKENSAQNSNYILSVNSIKEFFVKIFANIALADNSFSSWIRVGDQDHPLDNYANIYGDIHYNLTELKPSTNYSFMAVAEDASGTTNGNVLNFKTNPTTQSTNGGSSCTSWSNPPPTCTYPYVLNTSTNTCVTSTDNQCPAGSAGTYPNCTVSDTGTCPPGSTGTYPNCAVSDTGTCLYGGTYPNCNISNNNTCIYGGTYPNCNIQTGGGNNGTGYNGNGYNGTSGSGYGSGSGGNNGNGNNNTNIINTTPLVLGQKATPPSDAIVHSLEGIETVFARQITADNVFAKKYGYQDGTDLQTFAWALADQFARSFGYVNGSGKEIRVSKPDVAAYQLQLIGDKLTVYEYYNNKIVDVRSTAASFKNASGYEYYFKK